MPYKIKDLQFSGDQYFADGEKFKTKREACEQLISYHSIDCDMHEEQKLLNAGKVGECWDLLAQFEWELEKI